MATISRGDKKSINKFVEEQKMKGAIVMTGKINLSGKDKKIDTQKETISITLDSDDRFGIMMEKLKGVKKEAPIEKVVKAKVAAVSNCIRSMRRVNSTESNIYCMTTKQLKARSVITITSPSTDYNYNTFGLFDKRLGCTEKKKTCITCFRKHGKCEGHEGFIPFPYGFINPLFQKDVIYALKSTCRYCGHVYANKDLIKAAGLNKLSGINYKKALAEISSSLHGLHKHPKNIVEYYENNMKDHKVTYRLVSGDKGDLYEKPIEDIKTIFENYDENDHEILGYPGETKPKAFIMEGINTISPNLRLPGYVNGKLVNHYTTLRYIDLIKATIKLNNNKDCSDDTLGQILADMYSKIKEIFFGPENKANSRVAEQDGGLMTKLLRKEGLLRKHGMGKRVNDSCRSVADPSVDGNTGEIGIPRTCAEFVTVRENVHRYNRKLLSDGIKAGVIKYVILVKDGEEQKYEIPENQRRSFRLEIGDVVVRPIRDGDIVLCGRQPSLHAASLMGFRVYLHDDEVVKISIENLAAFNLDFDGDEVTFHIIQTVAAQVEAITTASSLHHLMNEQANRVMISPAFYATLASYIGSETWHYMTYDEFDDDEFNQITRELLSINSLDELKKTIATFREIEREKVIERRENRIKEMNKEINSLMNEWWSTEKKKNKEVEKQREKLNTFTKTSEEYINNFDIRTEQLLSYDSLEQLSNQVEIERKAERKRAEEYFMSFKRQVMIPDERWEQALSLVNDSHRKRTLKARCEKHGIPYKSARALLSLPFPANLTCERDDVKIVDGILVKGVLRKSNIGTGEKSLIQVIFKLYSIKEADRFINEIIKLADWFIMWHGFSIGHHTFVTNRQEIQRKIYNIVNGIQGRFYNLGEIPKDEKDKIFWKKMAFGMMDKGQIIGKDIGNSNLKRSNGLVVAGSDGAMVKGSYMNNSQITGMLACQAIKADIQVAELNGGTRRLVMFLPNDCSLESIGYILQSFYDGLKPSGMFFHMASSREGLVDTANNTSDIGYTHRKLEKALEDTIIDSRGMISSTTGKIFVFTYCGISIAHQVFTNTVQSGKKLSFCDFNATANMVNRLYESMCEKMST